MQNRNVKAQIALSSIRDKVLAYHKLMNDIIKYVNTPTADTRSKPNIDPRTQYLQFYIDKAAVLRLLEIAVSDNFKMLGVFFGLDEKKNNKLTASFIGLDANYSIIPQHFVTGISSDGTNTTGPLQGEEDWPPPPPVNKRGKQKNRNPMGLFTLNSKPAEIETFFNTNTNLVKRKP